MKRWLFYVAAIALVAITGYMPFSGSDVGMLQPIELIQISAGENEITVKTDTGDMGYGKTVSMAFADLKKSTAGKVFLDTADFLLIRPSALPYLMELTDILRPACKVCLVNDDLDLQAAAEFLRVQEDIFTLHRYRAGEREIPYLAVNEERMHLVSKES